MNTIHEHSLMLKTLFLKNVMRTVPQKIHIEHHGVPLLYENKNNFLNDWNNCKAENTRLIYRFKQRK